MIFQVNPPFLVLSHGDLFSSYYGAPKHWVDWKTLDEAVVTAEPLKTEAKRKKLLQIHDQHPSKLDLHNIIHFIPPMKLPDDGKNEVSRKLIYLNSQFQSSLLYSPIFGENP